MSCYVTLQQVKDLGSMPEDDIDVLETQSAGLTLAIATAISGDVDSRLRKRYALPLATPYPDSIVLCVARMTAWRLWLKRGYNPQGALDQQLQRDDELAREWLKEVSDGKEGLLELPTSDSSGSRVTRGAPLGYSEISPFRWITVQAEAAEDE